MSDLFHKDIPLDFITRVCETMERAHWHTFQVLTKRSSLMRDFLQKRYGRPVRQDTFGLAFQSRTENGRDVSASAGVTCWGAVSIDRTAYRTNRKVNLTGIDWVIAGGESRPKARPMKLEWAQEVRDQCRENGVAFSFKQWGGIRPKSGGRELDGREWNEFPNVIAS